MDTLIHADIFFFVTTVVVVVLGVALLVALIYLIQAIRRIRDIASQIREETVLFREDVKELRSSVRREGFAIGNAFKFIQKLISHKKTKKSK
jgi:Na+/melibiose symporter-like transporter